jgi:hypothetical protein
MAKTPKLIKKEPSLLSKSISPLLIFITICVLAYVGYKIYTAVQNGIRYAELLDPCVELLLMRG